MKTLEDRPVRVAREPYLLHCWRMLLWLSELRLVPYRDERRRDPVSALLRAVLFDGLTRTGKVLLLIAVMILLLSFRNFQIFYLSTAASILVLLVWSRLLSSLHRPKVALRRTAPEYAEVGRVCRSRVSVRHTGRFKLQNFTVRELAVRHAKAPPEWSLPHRAALPPGGAVAMEVSCTPQRRGLLTLTGVAVETYFPFFVTRAIQRVEAVSEIPVLPAPFSGALPSLRQMAQRAAESVEFGNQSGGRERTLDYLHSRPFQSGDSVRRLDQRASARRGEPLTRIYDGTALVKPQGLALILDTAVAAFPAWKPRPDDPLILDRRLAVAVDLARRGVAEGLGLSSVYAHGRWTNCTDMPAFYRLIATLPATHETPLPDSLGDQRLIYVLVCGRWNAQWRARVEAWRQAGRVALVMLVPESGEAVADVGPLAGFHEFPATQQWRKAA